MLNKLFIALLFSFTATWCFSLAEHCPFDTTEAYNSGWKFHKTPIVSQDSLLYVAFGKDRYNPTISIICIYRSGSWLHKTTREKFAETVYGNWVRATPPKGNQDEYYGYFCSYPDASNCIWDTI